MKPGFVRFILGDRSYVPRLRPGPFGGTAFTYGDKGPREFHEPMDAWYSHVDRWPFDDDLVTFYEPCDCPMFNGVPMHRQVCPNRGDTWTKIR